MVTTTNKGYELIVTGTETNTWGDLLNTDVFTFVDLNLGGLVSKSLTNVQVDLSATESRSLIVRLNGTLTGNVLVTTEAIGMTIVENLTSGAFAVTFAQNPAVGSAVTLVQGSRNIVITDGTNGPRLLVAPASETVAGVVELATTAEVQALTDTERAVTPAGLAALTPVDSRLGLIELATNAEVTTGTDAVRAVTPASLQQKTASDTALGLSRYATAAEAAAASSTTLVVTPGRQKANPLHPKAWVSFNQSGAHSDLESSGVSSIADTGTGKTTITFSTAFAATTYGAIGMSHELSAGSNPALFMCRPNGGTKTTTQLQVLSCNGDSSDQDAQSATVIAIGAQ
jgi:hypothetical protein